MGVSGQRHAPAALYPWGKDPRYPMYRGLGDRASLDTEVKEKSLAPAGEQTSIARSSSP
jgi:hypothetical protein